MSKHLILVAGNIGSGKTSLTERLGQRLGWYTAYESVLDNPYLPNFYKDMKTWSFQLQVFFSWTSRPRQHMQMQRSPLGHHRPQHLEDAFIFCRPINHLGNLNETGISNIHECV
jgi:deoxyadenosine/deoxycytidine kinase